MEESNANYLEDSRVDVPDVNNLILDFSDDRNNAPVSANSGVFQRRANERANPFWTEDGMIHVSESVAEHIGGYDFTQHCHPQIAGPRDTSAQRTLIIVSVMTFFFIIGEVVGGTISGSIAVLTDASHMLSDLASFLISLLAIWIGRRPATKNMSFGFYRAEVLGAVCSILVIWVLTGILVYVAVDRVHHPEKNFNADVMLITAGIGVLFNVVMGLVLHFSGHGHSHGLGGAHADGHGHGHSHEGSGHIPLGLPSERRRGFSLTAYPSEDVNWAVNKQKNINVRAAFVHVVGDLVQSIGVLIAALIIKFTGKQIADPICTFLFSVLVLITTLTVLRDAIHVLMEGTPRDVDYNQVRLDLQQIEGVKTAHSLHMWSLTMDKAALAVHLAIDKSSDALTVMHNASRMMRYKYNLTFTTIQVEPHDPNVMGTCSQCLGPTR